MANAGYKRQVALLLSVLPEVANESCFALHGGTAINLFVRDMPRLSVDIDLTYVPVADREASLAGIAAALERIKASIEKVVPGVHVAHRKDIGKLLVQAQGSNIKVEVNLTNRGILAEAVKMTLCGKAQNEFQAFCAVNVVATGQLYGGKICAALDRQHPRDLFDVKYLLANEGFSEQVKSGFLLCLLSSDRPIKELLAPNLQDQRAVMNNQFAGMSEEAFSYEEYEAVRTDLVATIRKNLTAEDRQFLLSVKNLAPDWTIYNFQQFPAIGWKLQNLQRLKDGNPKKHREMYEALEVVLSGF